MLKQIKRNIQNHSTNLFFTANLASNSFRILPTFIIIGGMKCATTALYTYLTEHPNIISAFRKEVHYFDLNYHKGLEWYRSHFPLCTNSVLRNYSSSKIITGEASPYYMLYPHAPKRVAKLLPDVKLIAILRNPIDRAYSHYRHQLRLGKESLSFEEAIEKEAERLEGELEKIMHDETYTSKKKYGYYSYLLRGIYIDQLKNWFRFFKKEQMLILKTEDLQENPSEIYNKVIDFLELPYYELKRYEKIYVTTKKKAINSGRLEFSGIEKNVRRKLLDYFEPHNQRLYQYLGTDFGWGENRL
ncbi:sulfotransferase domain-containing protein [Gloeocapsa sp. BRSZ]